MKAGFLGGKTNAGHTSSRRTAETTSVDAGGGLQNASPAAHPVSSTPPGQPVSEASWQKCMELLRSGSEEKKFVGLLLVTKLLPHGDETALTEVLAAVGWPFLQRMLLPLRQQQQDVPSTEKLQQQQLSVSLGLSIISATARVQEVAASEDLLQLTPLIAKVAAAGGVSNVLLPQTHHSQQQQQQRCGQQQVPVSCADTAGDLSTAVDALECLLACASSGSYQRTVLLESNGLQTATAALASALTAAQQVQGMSAPSSTPAGKEEEQEASAAAAAAAAAARAVMLSVQLLGALLGGDAQTRSLTIQQDPVAAAAAVMLLARIFGSQVLPDSSAAPHGGNSWQQQARGVDKAALQLEALHTLLLLLPLPDTATQAHTTLTAAAATAAAVSGSQPTGGPEAGLLEGVEGGCRQLLSRAVAIADDWPAALRHGLVQLLRGRVGAVQRHSALQLAAAALELLGPAWLLPQQHQGQQLTGSSKPEEFLLVLVEVLGIETTLLLSDAMNPGAAVPRADEAVPAAAAAADVGAEADGNHSTDTGAVPDVDDDDVDMSDEAAEQHGAAAPLSVRQAVEQQQQQQHDGQVVSSSSGSQPSSTSSWSGPPGFQQQGQQLKPLRQQLAELKLPEDGPVGERQQPAGARALQVLPSCYQLLEGCLEVLVQQVSLLEGLGDLEQQVTPAGQAASGAAGGDSGSDVFGGRPVTWQEVLPVLGLGQVEQLMTRMGQVTEVLCEFLDYSTSPTAGASQGAAPVDPWLVLGAVRLLGRFLADAPDAHQHAIRQLLPRLLKLQLEVPAPTAAAAAAGAGQPALQPLQEQVVSFLLPAMLSWTSKHSDNHQQWAEYMLRPGSGCLLALAAYISHAAATAAAVGGCVGAQDGSSSRKESEAQLGTACQVLYQLLSCRATLLSTRGQQHHQQPQAQAHSSLRPPGLHKAQAAALTDVLQQLSAWSAGRHQQAQLLQQQQQQQGLQPHTGSVPAVAAAAEAELLRLQGIGLDCTVLLPAAALAGQLLGLVVTPADTATAAAHLLCWGCQVGWCVQLMGAVQQQAGGSNSSSSSSVYVSGCWQQQQLQVWEVAELDELWEGCLLCTAELLTEQGAGSALGRVLSAMNGRDGWLRQARQAMHGVGGGVPAVHGAGDPTAAAVVERSTGLELLLQGIAALL